MKKPAVKKTKVVNELPKEVTSKEISNPENEIQSKMSKLGNAYLEALNGKLKFGKIKDLFKKFHKEIKKTKK
jgi:hypothetical protein